jgi:glucose-1-phosphate cytidylyltransferase
LKAVILAGGLGTRLSEETGTRPKPMVTIGDMPILWHIMKLYSHHGIHDFIICLGYKGHIIKQFFAEYALHRADVTFNFRDSSQTIHRHSLEPWQVTLVDTGKHTQVGGRIARILPWVENDEAFCLTYGDGVANIDLTALVAQHQQSGALATVTAVQPPGRFGALRADGDRVISMREKPNGDDGWINGGFFVLSPKIDRYLDGDSCVWEREPMQALAAEGQLNMYRHTGFWQPMDTLRDRHLLESLWADGSAPWKLWT